MSDTITASCSKCSGTDFIEVFELCYMRAVANTGVTPTTGTLKQTGKGFMCANCGEPLSKSEDMGGGL
jgi:hypothetical protein